MSHKISQYVRPCVRDCLDFAGDCRRQVVAGYMDMRGEKNWGQRFERYNCSFA